MVIRVNHFADEIPLFTTNHDSRLRRSIEALLLFRSLGFKLWIVAPKLVIRSIDEPLHRSALDARDDGVFLPLRTVSNRARVARDQKQFALLAYAPLHVRVDTNHLMAPDLQQRGAVLTREIDVLRVGDNDGVRGLVQKVDSFERVLAYDFVLPHLSFRSTTVALGSPPTSIL